MTRFLLLIVVTLTVIIAWILHGLMSDLEPPVLPEFYWGPKSKAGQKEDTSIRPFSIKIEDRILTDLKARLKLETSENENRLTPPLEGIGFQYGVNSNFLKNLTSHWLNKYDWKSREVLLNRYPQFKTRISGIQVHFLHIKPSIAASKKYKKTVPLLLIHGWPSSFVEYNRFIPLLTEPKDSDVNYELIIPSLPGFGFSEASHQPGLGRAEAAQLFLKLMQRLGHGRFYVHGGDWGALVGTNMASLYPNNVAGFHSNMCLSAHPKTIFRLLLASIYPSLFLDQIEIPKSYPLSKLFSTLMEEMGYFHIQATKPDTVGASLSNSPSGLAAYILEKFSSCTNLEWRKKEDGGLLPYFDINELLDNIMIYWVTNSITSSMRFYSESFSLRQFSWNLDRVPVKVPTACVSSPQEFWGYQAEFHLQDMYPRLWSHTKLTKGGHFLAMEFPQLLAKDVISFFNLVERNSTTS